MTNKSPSVPIIPATGKAIDFFRDISYFEQILLPITFYPRDVTRLIVWHILLEVVVAVDLKAGKSSAIVPLHGRQTPVPGVLVVTVKSPSSSQRRVPLVATVARSHSVRTAKSRSIAATALYAMRSPDQSASMTAQNAHPSTVRPPTTVVRQPALAQATAKPWRC